MTTMATLRPPTHSLLRLLLLILLMFYPTTILCSSAQPPSPLDPSSSSSTSTPSSSSIPQQQPQPQQQQQQQQQHPPRCIAADSYHTYICTENAEATRRAIEQFASNGNDDLATITTGSTTTTTSTISLDKNTLPTTLYSHHNNIDLGVEQRITGSDTEQTNIRTMIKRMHIYMEEEVYSRSEYEIVRMNGKCKNHHELCAFWSSVGECETNRGFMMENCVAACRLCLLASVNMMMA